MERLPRELSEKQQLPKTLKSTIERMKADISRLKIESPLPATSTQPSAHAYALLGAMPGSAEPAASRTAPNALYSGSRLSMQLNTAS